VRPSGFEPETMVPKKPPKLVILSRFLVLSYHIIPYKKVTKLPINKGFQQPVFIKNHYTTFYRYKKHKTTLLQKSCIFHAEIRDKPSDNLKMQMKVL